jgi:hypothetical protein
MKRLDLDAAKSKQKKNKMLSNTPTAMADVNKTSLLLIIHLLSNEFLEFRCRCSSSTS